MGLTARFPAYYANSLILSKSKQRMKITLNVNSWVLLYSLQTYAIFPPVSDLLLPKCVKIISINAPVDDPTRATENYGLHAEKKGVVLSAKPGIFKVHKGLLKENGTVSLEAVFHPKHFLRHKNYKFHLEKELNNSMFCELFKELYL